MSYGREGEWERESGLLRHLQQRGGGTWESVRTNDGEPGSPPARAVYFPLMPLRPDKWSCWRARNLRGEGSRARSKHEHKVKTKARGSRSRLQRAKPVCTLSGEVCQIFTHAALSYLFCYAFITQGWFRMC